MAVASCQLTLPILLDLSEAFDTIILLDRLASLGVMGACLSWFKLYISGRTEFVQFQI